MLLQRCESKFKIRKLNDTVEEDNVTQMEPNFTLENTLVSEPEADLRPHTTEPTTEGFVNVIGYKGFKDESYGYGIRMLVLCTCVCFLEELLDSLKIKSLKLVNYVSFFWGKVTVEMKEDSRITVLECFGNPQYKKKIAAEQAAEAALWYLKNVGYTLQTEKASGRKGRSKPISKMMVTGEPV
ncbi:hypothetical protein [Arabidopsis thaliana]|uniref:A_IG005I10.3 protein n=1 Tax=Arabidopsis thaliana TaxID=3702 RepID=O23060_ARATH|nr:contains regions of weak similarity to immunoglobulin heavy chain variable region [Arabidopsis thaliana]AAF02783.1 contains regions of weak similarity to immunoglobulin heavy chain variable region [Arabidopsis thaliana]CAB80800.1 hypothetical protein [Arabidopsis thaliana]